MVSARDGLLQQDELSSIPIIYIPNPSSSIENLVLPNSPPARFEMLSQKLFMDCQVKRQ